MTTNFLNSDQKLLQQEIIAFAAEHLNQGVARRDVEQIFDRHLWEKCGQLQLPGLAVAKEYGGRGLDVVTTTAALEALGYGCMDNGLSFSLGAHLLACVIPIWLYGSEEQKQRLLPGLCNGQLIAANAITEASSGSDTFEMQTVATEEGGHYLLNGEKNFCSNSPVADIGLVYGLTNKAKKAMGGVTAFILERQAGHFLTGGSLNKAGLRSCLTGSLSITDARVPESAVLGKKGSGTIIFLHSMTWERIGLSAVHLGTLARLSDKALALHNPHLDNGSYNPLIAHRLAKVHAELEAARMLVYQAAYLLQTGNRQASTRASQAKLLASETYKRNTGVLLELLPEKALHGDSDFARCYRDAVGSTIYSGTSEIQKNVIAKYLGFG
ncbi:MAG TPA: acyl-CoA dehydrogenase family protein [Saprospiraceae bacterium]|nr:acyl-CoA dehydrogenase family protein [Saprospiraceae bacterium]HMQ82647.1 acyl-CoA dehydrogenase family protein [Saprospiraceae bacterium]